jgi:hypothetical protein
LGINVPGVDWTDRRVRKDIFKRLQWAEDPTEANRERARVAANAAANAADANHYYRSKNVTPSE